ncbi:MAG TPA: hypothetical protein VJM11_20805 [Nevskiaceae bacterium]|nr:hypothetical protein [Nevskiaceae bacterium]
MPTTPRAFPLTAVAATLLGTTGPVLAAPGDPLGPETQLVWGGVPRLVSVAAADPQGNLVAIAGQDGEHFSPAGVAVGPAFDLGTDGTPGEIAMEPDGDFVVAWRTGVSPQRLWARVYAADGAPKGAAIPVFQAPDLLGGFDVAVDADGDFVVAWDDMTRTALIPSLGYMSPLLLNQNIRVQRYTSAGLPNGAAKVVAHRTSTTGDIGDTRVAMEADGDFVVLWQASGTTTNGIRARSYRANGVARTLARTVEPSGNAHEAVIAMAPDGAHAVGWTGFPNGSIYAHAMVRLYDPAGKPRGPAFAAHAPATDARFAPAIGFSSDGHFVVAWVTNPTSPENANDVYARRFAPNGAPLAAEFLASVSPERNQNSQEVFFDADGLHFTLLWRGRSSLYPSEGTFVRRFEGP